MDTPLTTATLSLKATLTQAAASGELGRVAGDALGLLSVPESFWQLQQAWAKGQFRDFPTISLSTGGSMAEARGAYVAETDSILLNQEWLNKASEAEVLAVLAEEVGHSLDTRFNSTDTPGDEGELFSRLLLGQVPSASERARITSDNDAIQVTLANGRQARAEAADALDPVVRLTGTNRADQLSGGSNNDALFGLSGTDELIGGAGNDYLDGGQGADTMTGGLGDDIYIVDNSSDLVLEASDEGKDSILSTISLALPANVENLDLRTNGEATGTGNDLNNVIYGGFGASRLVGGAGNDSLYGRGTNDDHLEGGIGNDYLDGGQGIDLMEGGLGDDAYVVRDSADHIIENAQEGNDWVYATTSYTLSDNIENLQLYGTGDGLKATGNGQNNTLIGDQWANGLSGGAGNDYLNGGGGADTMDGGTGNDTYIVDNEGDSIIELSGEGTDWVISTVNHTLASNVDHLDLRGTANLVGTGNGDDNIIKGNAGNSTLHGGAGNDSLYGRGSGSDTLFGDEGNDYLDGGAGADTLDGGIGNDTYVVDNAGDRVIEATNGGTDWVSSDISYTLGDNLEGLRLRGLTGAEDLNGSGNDLNNTIYGNAGRNTLNGGGGNDVLNGGAGSDSLFGGAGSDLFVIANKEADGSLTTDKIGDFQTGSDVLYLSRAALNIDASKLGSGVLKATDFKLVTSSTEGGLDGANGLASTAAFVFDQTSGILYHNANGAEFGAGDNSAGIVDISGANLKASDIQLF
jgi:Ca2+-binding RTX toxin-like protein